jgi:hypothetical protein
LLSSVGFHVLLANAANASLASFNLCQLLHKTFSARACVPRLWVAVLQFSLQVNQ